MIEINRSVILGDSPFATTFAGTFNKIPVAIKRIERNDIHPNWATVEDCAEKMTNLDHPNIVKILHIYDSQFRFIVMELCLANLENYCRKLYDGMVPTHRDGFCQLVNGLHYIHSQGFIHRQVNTKNILISKQFKISDFGLHLPKYVSERDQYTMKEIKPYLCSQAPEILHFNGKNPSVEESEANHTTASDTFSLGCVLTTFLTRGNHPFGVEHHMVPTNILEGKYNFPVDMPYIHIIEQMIKKCPHERISLHQILSMKI